MIETLFFDIDGTLVSFDTHKIPQSTITALQQAKSRGKKVIISTGRPKVCIDNLGELESKGIIDGYITMNGAYCFVGNDIIYSAPIPHQELVTALNYLKTYNCSIVVMMEHEVRIINPTDFARNLFSEILNFSYVEEITIEEAIKHDIFQVTPFITAEQQEQVEQHLSECEFSRWHEAFVDITRRGNNKALGIDYMAKYFGISLDSTMAFGDGGNDIPMLKHAKVGVAMGNSMPTVKENADYVTTNIDEDGVYNALKHYNVI